MLVVQIAAGASVATISLIVTRSILFRKVRNKVQHEMLHELITCPFCFSVWVSMLVCIYTKSIDFTAVTFINYWLQVFLTVAIAAPIMALIFKSVNALAIE